MNACYGSLQGLSREALERLAAGEGDPPECEVTGAALVLAEMDAREAWRDSFGGPTGERLRRWKRLEGARQALQEQEGER